MLHGTDHPMTTDSYTKDKRAATSWVTGIIAVLLTGGLGFLGSQLMAHETAIAVVKEKQQTTEKRLDGMDAKLDKILDKLNKNP
jgi:hypothetical protein